MYNKLALPGVVYLTILAAVKGLNSMVPNLIDAG